MILKHQTKSFVIDEDFHGIWGDLNDETLRALDEEIRRDGFRDPLVYWMHDGKKILIDGHNRLKIAKMRGVGMVPATEIEFEDKAEAAEWIVKHQQNRRNMTDGQKYSAGLKLKKIIEEEAKKNRQSNLKRGPEREKSPDWENSPSREECSNDAASGDFEKSRTRRKIAEATGLSDWQVRQGDYIMAHGTEKQKSDLGSGEKTIKEVYQETHEPPAPSRRRRQPELKPLPESPEATDYDLIYGALSTLLSIKDFERFLETEEAKNMPYKVIADAKYRLMELEKVNNEWN